MKKVDKDRVAVTDNYVANMRLELYRAQRPLLPSSNPLSKSTGKHNHIWRRLGFCLGKEEIRFQNFLKKFQILFGLFI